MLSTSEPFHDKLHLPLSFLTEPSFVHADVIREGRYKADGEDDKIYFFFTEVSVEYEFFGKLLIPRVARVCKVSSRHVPSCTIMYQRCSCSTPLSALNDSTCRQSYSFLTWEEDYFVSYSVPSLYRDILQ